MKFSSNGRAQADEDHETIMRVRATMDAYLASHGEAAMVSVKHVRDLLDPRGLWTFDRNKPQQQETPKGPPAEDDLSLADPMTGCLPVTAPGA